jgi:hypothetical protein
MKLPEQIRIRIQQMPKGSLFGYADLDILPNQYVGAAKVLERLQQKEVIKKLSKGRFYRPEKTLFGELQPDYQEQLSAYLFEDGKRIAYVTGSALYNEMGLTRQLTFRIKIASQTKRITINRGALQAKAVKSYVAVTDQNYQLLGYLDALKDIKQIPDASVESTLAIMRNLIKNVEPKKRTQLVAYAQSYPARVRALLGAIFESDFEDEDVSTLKASLNPLTSIKLGITPTMLATAPNWNIV